MFVEIEDDKIDKGLYSRQLYVMGIASQQKLSKNKTLLIGLSGLGIEIGKFRVCFSCLFFVCLFVCFCVAMFFTLYFFSRQGCVLDWILWLMQKVLCFSFFLLPTCVWFFFCLNVLFFLI